MENKLRLAIPNGSLEEGTFKLFQEAGLPIQRGGKRDYNSKIDDPRICETLILRPKEIAEYVNEGEFDFGITGFDWVTETGAMITEIADLQFSRGGFRKVKIVLATNNDNPVEDPKDIRGDARIATEYPQITKRYFRKLDKGKVKIRTSSGATEIKVPRLAEYLVDVTETGTTLQANGKKIIAVIMESSTKLIANQNSWKNPEKRKSMQEIADVLLGVIIARSKILLKMNVTKDNLSKLVSELPAMKYPTISPIIQLNSKAKKMFAVETVIEKSSLNEILPRIRRVGATDILEIGLEKIIP
jgi:ATP phosphoribosyltransferase